MKNSNKSAAIFLIFGILIMVATMVLHPAGGGFDHLIDNATIAILSHSLAIFSVPFSALGFIGLTQVLSEDKIFSRLALAFMITGLMAALVAAALNGLAQPMFALHYADGSDDLIKSISPIFRYNMALNHAFDYILIVAIMISMFLWSISILRTKVLSNWLAYFALLVILVVFVALSQGFYFLDLYGFRLFIFGWVTWVSAVAISIYKIRSIT